jgi:hypothetical protein
MNCQSKQVKQILNFINIAFIWNMKRIFLIKNLIVEMKKDFYHFLNWSQNVDYYNRELTAMLFRKSEQIDFLSTA